MSHKNEYRDKVVVITGASSGFGKGTARVSLEDDGRATLLKYQVEGSVGGKLAQIGQRLIDGAARQIADDFFVRFREAIAALPDSEAVAAIVAATPAPTPIPVETIPRAPDEPRTGLAPEVWVVGLIAIIASLLMVFGAVFPH